MSFTIQQLLQVQKAIDLAADSYYNKGVAIVTDDFFDAMLEQLRLYDPSDPRLTRVGHIPSLDKVAHAFPMGSLDNIDISKPEELASYIKRNKDKFDDDVLYHVTPKVDGSSIVLTYIDGKLASAVTRGNGAIGQDITAKAQLFQNVPTELPKPLNVTIRGEAVMHRETFVQFIAATQTEGVRNPRNIGNGLIVRKDAQGAGLISFYAFGVQLVDTYHPLTAGKQLSVTDQYDLLSDLGFSHPPYGTTKAGGLADLIDHMVKVDVPYDIDGAVVKIDAVEHRDIINDGGDPLRLRSDRAIKFNSKKTETVITGVTVTVGATGKITPTLMVEPVEIGGIINSNVLVHNYNEIARLQIGIGDTVQIVLAGDIIPRVLKMVSKSDSPSVLAIPDCCPVCQGNITRKQLIKGDSADLYCTNTSCPGIKLEGIRKFIGSSKKGMGILGIGDKLSAELVNSGRVQIIPDLYSITAEELAVMNMGDGLVGASRAAAIVHNIQASKSASLKKVLGALPINGLGERRAEIMMRQAGGKLDVFDQWITWASDMNYDVSLSHPHLPPVTMKRVREQLQTMLPTLSCLRDLGIGVPSVTAKTPDTDVSDHGKPFAGKTFCFTGTRIYQDVVEQLGGEIKSGVSKALHFLVQRDPSERTTKAKKAELYGTTVIGVPELKEMIQTVAPTILNSTGGSVADEIDSILEKMYE